MTDRNINVLVVDDSDVARMHLVRILESDPQIRVIAAVNNGQAALDFVSANRPDVILMDIHMPGMDGFEVTRRIMETQPVPIIICSATTDPREVAITFRVMEAGAVACLEKPVGREHAEFERMAANLRQTIKLMSEVKVVRRWARMRPVSIPSLAQPASEWSRTPGKVCLIGIGTSTGGPPVLQTILAGLPKDFPVPILIVQHIAEGFLPGLAEWLNQTTGFKIHIAASGVCPLPGHVYLAPDGFHMGLGANGHIRLTKEEPENGLRPAVSYLFRSLAEACGPSAVGVLLTGMGKDGAAELKLMRDKGATTIAQDRESSIVHGMPGEAIALDGATHVLPAEKDRRNAFGSDDGNNKGARPMSISKTQPANSPVDILIVEDSPTQAQRLQHILEKQGYRATHAANGRLALEAAARQKPTLIVSDVIMPEMDGYELCRRVKADSALANVPVFLVTTLSDPQDVIRGLECRADNFILKPYDEQYLLSRVKYMLLNREMHQADRMGMGVEIFFNGQRHFITSDRLQILNLLISTYDAAIQRNKELSHTQEELRDINQSLRESNRRLELEIKERKLAEEALRASQEKEVRLSKDLRELNENLERLVVERTGALRESEERFRQLTENIDDVFWLADLSETRGILYISPAYEKVWGRTCASLYASKQGWLGAIHPDDRARIRATGGGKQIGDTYTEEYRIVRPDGAIRWIHDRGFPVRNEAGEIYRIAGVAKDITERKEAEDARQKLEDQLRQTQKMNAIGQLAGGIAHDFNNLLTVINGHSQLILDRLKPDGKTREALELIYRTGERAADLTRQLLAFSRKQVLTRKVLSLNAVAAEMEKMLRRLLGEDIILSSFLDPALACVKADPSQVEQVIVNLAVNARDAMPNGGTLTIETANSELSDQYCSVRSEVKPGAYAMLAVSDTGCGMDSATKARIFEPFFTTKEPGKGTGLGLATVYGIVKQNDGHIEVYSEPGKGTTFKIYLPQSPDAAVLAPGSKHAAPPRGNETVLVAEDEIGIRDLVREILEGNGYTVLAAASGAEALRAAEKHTARIHLLLTDVVMPGISGLELAEGLKASRPDLKVLFTSGFADHAIVRSGTLDASTHFLQKPFTPNALARKVREVLDSVERGL